MRIASAMSAGVMRADGRAGVGAGRVFFAGIVMMVGGFFAFFEGLAAVLKGGSFYAKVPNYPFGTNVTTWGWIVLIAGIIVLLAGLYVMTGAPWAKIVGITLASLSALANSFFIPSMAAGTSAGPPAWWGSSRCRPTGRAGSPPSRGGSGGWRIGVGSRAALWPRCWPRCFPR